MSSAGKLLIASALAAVFATACTSTQIAPVSDNSTTGTIKSGPASVPAAPAASSSGAQVVPLSGGSGFSGGSAMSSAAPAASGNTYTVKAGDTLYRIAKNHGVNVNELMRVNGISDPRKLAVGRTLQIPGAGRPAVRVATAPVAAHQAQPTTAPASQAVGVKQPAAPAGAAAPAAVPAATAHAPTPIPGTQETLSWPVTGDVVSHFTPATRGIDISSRRGTAVKAAANGEVLLTSTAFKGYGNLVILRHGDGTFVTTYGQLQTINVKKGEHVKAGQKIGTVGGFDASKPVLHFEVRIGGKPVDPSPYLR